MSSIRAFLVRCPAVLKISVFWFVFGDHRSEWKALRRFGPVRISRSRAGPL
jgi:hypothetical protein